MGSLGFQVLAYSTLLDYVLMIIYPPSIYFSAFLPLWQEFYVNYVSRGKGAESRADRRRGWDQHSGKVWG